MQEPNRTLLRRILVKAPNWVGDALLSTPALTCLGKSFPDSEITVLAAPWVIPVLETHPSVKQTLVYDPKGQHKSWSARREVCSRLRQHEFDLAILFPNSFHSALITYLSGIPQRVGYATDGRSWLLTKSVPRNPAYKSQHQAEYYLELVRSLAVEVTQQDRQLVLNLTPEDKQWARQFLGKQDKLSSGLLIAIHPGAVKPGKRWPYKRFAQVGKTLIERYQAHLLLLGSQSERSLLEQIRDLIGSQSQTIVCGESLRNVAALFEHCRLFVGNDSGLMHMATAIGAPIAVIFGPGAPQTTAPYSKNVPYEVIMKEISCRPCRQRFFEECSPSEEGVPPCLDGVQVEEVISAVENLITKRDL